MIEYLNNQERKYKLLGKYYLGHYIRLIDFQN